MFLQLENSFFLFNYETGNTNSFSLTYLNKLDQLIIQYFIIIEPRSIIVYLKKIKM